MTSKKCAVCGETLQEGALACPKCGSGVFESSKSHNEPNGRKQQMPSTISETYPSPDALLIIVDNMPDDRMRFIDGLKYYLRTTLKPGTKVLLQHFKLARDLKNVVIYTTGIIYRLKEEKGWEFDPEETIFQDFHAQFTSQTIGGYVAFLYQRKLNR